MHGSSRFVLASELSKRREISDAGCAFAKGKEMLMVRSRRM
jgi:hypothetical protein